MIVYSPPCDPGNFLISNKYQHLETLVGSVGKCYYQKRHCLISIQICLFVMLNDSETSSVSDWYTANPSSAADLSFIGMTG